MEQDQSLDLLLEACLERLDLARLADWDALVFLYRHRASLASAEQIARLLGYTSSIVGDALDRLESLGLIQRSRASQGVRLYQFLVSTFPPLDEFQQLMRLAESRNGRLLLAKKLRQRASRQQARDGNSLQLLKGRATWPKAV